MGPALILALQIGTRETPGEVSILQSPLNLKSHRQGQVI
jgi:hypothetical protein